jgi:hypothetical protein
MPRVVKFELGFQLGAFGIQPMEIDVIHVSHFELPSASDRKRG